MPAAVPIAVARIGIALTPRQFEVARGIAEGLTSKQIAKRLRISDHTVRSHRDHLMRKLKVSSAAQIALAIAPLLPSPVTGEAQSLAGLAPREREIAELIGRGASSREVAAALGIAHSTARTHRQKILQKLGLRRASQLAALTAPPGA